MIGCRRAAIPRKVGPQPGGRTRNREVADINSIRDQGKIPLSAGGHLLEEPLGADNADRAIVCEQIVMNLAAGIAERTSAQTIIEQVDIVVDDAATTVLDLLEGPGVYVGVGRREIDERSRDRLDRSVTMRRQNQIAADLGDETNAVVTCSTCHEDDRLTVAAEGANEMMAALPEREVEIQSGYKHQPMTGLRCRMARASFRAAMGAKKGMRLGRRRRCHATRRSHHTPLFRRARLKRTARQTRSRRVHFLVGQGINIITQILRGSLQIFQPSDALRLFDENSRGVNLLLECSGPFEFLAGPELRLAALNLYHEAASECRFRQWSAAPRSRKCGN